MQKEASAESGKEESLKNKKQKDTVVSEALLKVLEILPVLQPPMVFRLVKSISWWLN